MKTHPVTTGPDTFEPLLDAARRGEEGALDALCARLYPRVQQCVHRALAADVRRNRPWLGALFSTGDVVQEVFLGVLKDIEDFRGHTEVAFVHYLATLTKNRLVDAIRFFEASRRDRRRVGHGEDVLGALEEGGGGPEELAIATEQIARFHRALSSFSERDRALLRARIEDAAAFEDISQALGYASADSARKAFHVAQAKLLARLRRLRND